MRVVTSKSIVIVLGVAIFFIWFGVGNFINLILYAIKPTTFEVGSYEIVLAYKHWGYKGSDEFSHKVVGKDGMVTLEVLKNPKAYPKMDEIFLDCYSLITEQVAYKQVSGRFITCEAPMKFIVFFKSFDGEIFMRSELNELLNEKFKKEYDIFLDGVKKKKR